MKQLLITAVTVLLFASASTLGKVELVQFETAQQQSLYIELITELRCLVCANQSLADSNADLAKDLRAKVQKMIADGHRREDIIDYMVKRYGEYILYRPSFSPATLLLWISPFLLIALICAFAIIKFSGKSRQQLPYSAAQLQEAKRLLAERGD